MKLYRAVILLLFLFLSCGGGSGSDGGGNGGGGGGGNNQTHFTATFSQGNNSVDYSPVSVTTQIGFNQVSIFTFSINGDTFDLFFERPSEVPVEINPITNPLHPKGGASITFGGNFYVYSSGTIFVTEMTNDRVAGDFNFLMTSQLDGSVIEVNGSFDLPNGIIALQ
jgi:hypothetical protein